MASFNPLVNQGTLSRLRASVTWQNFPQLNVTPSFLNRQGISLSFEGDVTKFIGTMTGVVTSGEPYQMIQLTINLLKTQGLAALYELQKQTSSVIGNGVVRGDASTLPPFPILNCGIANVRELNFSGEDAGYSITIGGYVLVNAGLWL